MSVLVVGVSHNTAPVSVLEWLTLDADGHDKLVRSVGDGDHVLEGTVLATCNRIEIYTGPYAEAHASGVRDLRAVQRRRGASGLLDERQRSHESSKPTLSRGARA